MSQNNTWIEMRFYGLLAFYEHKNMGNDNHMEVGVLKSAHGHMFFVALVEHPTQAGQADVPNIPYLLDASSDISLKVTQHPQGIQNRLNESKLLHFDGPEFHKGSQVCKGSGLRPGIRVYDGDFVGVEPYCYQVIRIESGVQSPPKREDFAFGVRATIERCEGREARLACADGEMTLNQNSNYTLLVNNSPPRISAHASHGHFQFYYDAFDQISTPRFDIRGPGTPNCNDPIPAHTSGHGRSILVTYQRPCLGIHLTESEPK